MRYLIITIFLAFAFSFEGFSQMDRVVQVSGVVVATDSLLPVPYVTIYRSKDNRGTYTDYNGYFTMPVHAGDTLNFICIGLKKSSFVVPYDSAQSHLSIVQWMQMENVMLPTVNVLPYPEPYKLRSELLALDLPGDRYYRFNRNIAAASTYDGLRDLSEDATNDASATLIARYTSGFKSGGNLLDPQAWGKFVRALKRGDDK